MSTVIRGILLTLLLSTACTAAIPRQTHWRSCTGDKSAVVVSRSAEPVDVVLYTEGGKTTVIGELNPGQRTEFRVLPSDAQAVRVQYRDSAPLNRRLAFADVRYDCAAR